jgi:hypothetical protein
LLAFQEELCVLGLVNDGGGETNCSKENLPLFQFVNHKFHGDFTAMIDFGDRFEMTLSGCLGV